jgi:hypothetical protein
MAHNSPITMPLSRCCMEQIIRMESSDDQGDAIICLTCSTWLVFWNGAWKRADSEFTI